MIKGLLWGTGTRFANWFYAMHRLLCQKPALKATIQNLSFASLSKTDWVEAAIKDIEDEVFGKQFIISSVLCFLPWKLQGIVANTFIQWRKSTSWWSEQIKRCLTQKQFLMTRISLDQWGEWFCITASKNWMKQIQKGMTSYSGEVFSVLNLFEFIFCDDDEHDKDAVCFVWYNKK